jgi:hypothetical protein
MSSHDVKEVPRRHHDRMGLIRFDTFDRGRPCAYDVLKKSRNDTESHVMPRDECGRKQSARGVEALCREKS